eukprot:scaffold182_cov350-Prasinococcus_capsulatus_cf.AAC.18
MKAFERKKVNAPFAFPLVLDMGTYTAPVASVARDGDGQEAGTRGGGSDIYDLCTVLLHKGGSATHGHYVALVLQEPQQLWWELDDEEATCIGTHTQV